MNAKGGRVRGIETSLGWGHGADFVAQIGLVEQRATYDKAEPDFGSHEFFRTPRRSLMGMVKWKNVIGDFFAASREPRPSPRCALSD